MKGIGQALLVYCLVSSYSFSFLKGGLICILIGVHEGVVFAVY